MSVTLALSWKGRAANFLHGKFDSFQNTNSYPFKMKTRNTEKNLFKLKSGKL